MLYSESLILYEGSLSKEVENAVSEIKEYFQSEELRVYSWDSTHVVVAAVYQVSLPSRGSIDNLIQPNEPILVRISLNKYPEESPAILSDRKNFPKDRLPHLYYSPENNPAVLCLVRDSLNQWFANITITDFLIVGAQWFYKAASGTLLVDNDEFDPVRLEKNTSGKHIYKYETFERIVTNDEKFVPAFPMALILSCLFENDNKSQYTFKSINGVPFIGLDNIKDTIGKAFQHIFTENKSAKVAPLFSLLVWDNDKTIEDKYSTNLPTNFGELKTYFSIRGIDVLAMLNALEKVKVITSGLVPIIHAVKRPKKLIGYPGIYEFFTYTISLPDDGLSGVTDELMVKIKSHTEPFSSELAQIMSNEKRTERRLFIGVGSLGSKILIHDARTGKRDIGAVDIDNFEQHNLARHVLYSNKIGHNKAEAIIDVVKAFYELDNTSNLIAYNDYISDVVFSELEKYDSIVDSTASQQVLQNFVLRDLPCNTQYSRCELVDSGQMGLLYIEGKERNPRIDDLFYTACYLATSDNDLYLWRRHDAESEPSVLNIGLGCNSVTTVMPDDLISFHASAFSQILSNETKELFIDSGLIYLNIFRKSNALPQISNRYYKINPFEVIPCNRDSGWTLRLFSGMTKKLLDFCSKHSPKETGGILIGVANYKTKTIYVFKVCSEPKGSIGTLVAFTRGIIGLPKFVDSIKHSTGEIIGYIGEWHTHPMNLESLSHTDLDTIEKLKAINKKTPIPTCAVIVTPKKVIPFVYDS